MFLRFSYSLRFTSSPSDSRGITSGFDDWFLGGLVSLGVESFPWPWVFFMACDCVECLVLKGLVAWQSYFVELLKYISRLLLFFAGNHSAMF